MQKNLVENGGGKKSMKVGVPGLHIKKKRNKSKIKLQKKSRKNNR